MSHTHNKPFDFLRIFFAGVGGQGTLLATRLVGEAALAAGLPVGMSEIHGMAQRGGVVESTIVVGGLSSPMIADGEADVLLAFEPLEGLRALPRCHAESLVVVNSVPIIPFTVAAGQGDYPQLDEIYQQIEGRVARLIRLDATEMAQRAGTDKAANVALVGVFAGTGRLPASRSDWEKGVCKVLPERLHEINLKAFSLGFDLGSSRSG